MAGVLARGGSGSGGSIAYPESASNPFNSNSARNNWANNNRQDLIENVTVVNVDGNRWYLWIGETNPTGSVSNSDWMEADQIVQGGKGDKGDTGDFGQIQSVVINGDDFVFTDNNGNTATLAGAVTDVKGDKGDAGDKGDTGDAALIVTATFDGDDIVFTDNDNNDTRLVNVVTQLQGDTGPRGETGPQGTPFIIQKQYDSLVDMNADLTGLDVAQNEMVMIASGAGVANNGEVYTKGAATWNYVTTLDGAASIQGVPGNDGLDGANGADGNDGASVGTTTVNSNGELEITLDNGVTSTAGRVTGLSAYELWLAEDNTGTEADYIAYNRERIKFNGVDVEGVEIGDDSGINAEVVGDNLVVSSAIFGNRVTANMGLPDASASQDLKVRGFRYHPSMPEMLLVEKGANAKVLDAFPNGASYRLTPMSHGLSQMDGSVSSANSATPSEPSTDKYKSIPLYVMQPDSVLGVRDNYAVVSYPESVQIDFSNGFYITTLISGFYAGNTRGGSFVFVSDAWTRYADGSGVGVSIEEDGLYVHTGSGKSLIDATINYNANNGQPVFYRVAVYQEDDGTLHTSVKNCLTGYINNNTVAATLITRNDAKVQIGGRREGNRSTVAIGETVLWIPQTDDDVAKVNFRS